MVEDPAVSSSLPPSKPNSHGATSLDYEALFEGIGVLWKVCNQEFNSKSFAQLFRQDFDTYRKGIQEIFQGMFRRTFLEQDSSYSSRNKLCFLHQLYGIDFICGNFLTRHPGPRSWFQLFWSDETVMTETEAFKQYYHYERFPFIDFADSTEMLSLAYLDMRKPEHRDLAEECWQKGVVPVPRFIWRRIPQYRDGPRTNGSFFDILDGVRSDRLAPEHRQKYEKVLKTAKEHRLWALPPYETFMEIVLRSSLITSRIIEKDHRLPRSLLFAIDRIHGHDVAGTAYFSSQPLRLARNGCGVENLLSLASRIFFFHLAGNESRVLWQLESMRSTLIRDTAHILHTPLELFEEFRASFEELSSTVSQPDSRMEKMKDSIASIEAWEKDFVELSKATLAAFDPLSSTRIATKTELVSVKALMSEVVDELSRCIAKKNIDINLNVTPVSLVVHIDARLLRKILFNLILNAIEAPGVKKTRVEAFLSRINQQENLVLSVADDGRGVDQHEEHRLFDPDFSTKAGVNRGLGLAVSSGYAQFLGGKLDYKRSVSPLFKGACLTLSVPIMRP